MYHEAFDPQLDFLFFSSNILFVQMDLFEIEAVEILKPQRVTIGHNRSGSGWFLDKVIVKEARNEKQEFVFPCDRCVTR